MFHLEKTLSGYKVTTDFGVFNCDTFGEAIGFIVNNQGEMK